MDWVDRPRNYKGLYGILQLLQGSHLDNFPQKTLTLGRVAFHSSIFNLIYIRNSPQCPHVCAMGRYSSKLGGAAEHLIDGCEKRIK